MKKWEKMILDLCASKSKYILFHVIGKMLNISYLVWILWNAEIEMEVLTWNVISENKNE